MKIISSANPKQEASDALAKIFTEYQNVPVLFLSSGGSALSLLTPEILARNAEMTVSVLDEHYVADPIERNFEKLKKTEFFMRVTQNYDAPPSPSFKEGELKREFDMRLHSPSIPLSERGGSRGTFDPYGGEVEEAGKRFDAFLKDWMVKCPEGKIVVTAGMGPDGHTVGIVPFSDAVSFEKLFLSPKTLAVGYKTDYGPFPARVTATFELLKKCSDVIFYAVGMDKKEAVQTLLNSEKPLCEFPALFLKTLPQAILYTDA